MSDPDGRVHWAPIAAFLACGTCLSSAAAGFSAFAAGFIGAFWAQWLPAMAVLGLVLAWIAGIPAAPRTKLREPG